MSHPEESAPCFNSAHTHANSSTPMSHFLCTVLLGFSCAHCPDSQETPRPYCGVSFALTLSESFNNTASGMFEGFSIFHILYGPRPAVFSPHFFSAESLCSLDLIVFSLLLPRLSTSFSPPCQKTQLSGMREGPKHRERGTATEAKTDDRHSLSAF